MENSKSEINKTDKRLSLDELYRSPEFWEEYIRTELFNLVQDYMDEHSLTRTALAKQLGVTKGYLSQVLNGDSDHRLSKLVSIAIQIGKAPYIYFRDLDQVIESANRGESIFLNFEESESTEKKDKPKRVQKKAAVP